MRALRRSARVLGSCLPAQMCAALTCAVVASPAAAGIALHVIPFPGTPDASPVARIIFSSLRPSDLKSVIVIGSKSGSHAGHLLSLPDGAGTAFIPGRPFVAGEQITVTARLGSPAAGTASGNPGATLIRFTFTVAVPVSSAARAAARSPGSIAHTWPGELAATTNTPTQHFHSAPALHPPTLSAAPNRDTASGDIFLTPSHTPQQGPMIVDSQGRLVWFDPVGVVANLEVQSYQGQPVLTWSQQTSSTTGQAMSKEVIVDRYYHLVKDLYAGDGYSVDLHDFQLTPQGTALIDAYVPVRADLQSVGGHPKGSVMDDVVQELDVKTGQLLWEWHVLGHVPLTASHAKPIGWLTDDYFHLNSIQALPNGNVLISARNSWGVYEIDKLTGRVIWSVGGKASSFKMGHGTNFEWQHDARLVGSTLTLFDDAALPQEERQSSAKVLRLDTTKMTASLVRRYTHSPPLLSPVTGSAQTLPNHNMFVGWGRQPYFSEYTPGGKQIFSASFPLGVASYRAFRFPWHARPVTRPSLAISPQGNGTVRVYASWNGATGVASWRVLGGSRPGELKALAHAPRRGFETRIELRSRPRYVAVEALGSRGNLLRTSLAKPEPSQG